MVPMVDGAIRAESEEVIPDLHRLFACSRGFLGIRVHSDCHKTTLDFAQELLVGRKISFVHNHAPGRH
jgi:hypothetical protein